MLVLQPGSSIRLFTAYSVLVSHPPRNFVLMKLIIAGALLALSMSTMSTTSPESEDYGSALAEDDHCTSKEGCSLELLQFRGDEKTNEFIPEEVVNDTRKAAGNHTEEDEEAVNGTNPDLLPKLQSGYGLIYWETWNSYSQQTYASVTCYNALNTMRANGRAQIENRLIQKTSYYVENAGNGGCSRSQSLSGGYQPATNMVTGRIAMSRSCRNAWRNKYGRAPTKVNANIVGECGYKNYDCHVERSCSMFGGCTRNSYGQLTVQCRVKVKFYG